MVPRSATRDMIDECSCIDFDTSDFFQREDSSCDCVCRRSIANVYGNEVFYFSAPRTFPHHVNKSKLHVYGVDGDLGGV